MWRCSCDCGNETEVSQGNLQDGHTKSRGCLQSEIPKENLKLIDGTSVTMIENRMITPIKSNKSGYNEVYYSHEKGSWCARITFKGKTYFLGSYEDIKDDAAARKKGEEMYDNFLEWYYSTTRDTNQD